MANNWQEGCAKFNIWKIEYDKAILRNGTHAADALLRLHESVCPEQRIECPGENRSLDY